MIDTLDVNLCAQLRFFLWIFLFRYDILSLINLSRSTHFFMFRFEVISQNHLGWIKSKTLTWIAKNAVTKKMILILSISRRILHFYIFYCYVEGQKIIRTLASSVLFRLYFTVMDPWFNLRIPHFIGCDTSSFFGEAASRFFQHGFSSWFLFFFLFLSFGTA